MALRLGPSLCEGLTSLKKLTNGTFVHCVSKNDTGVAHYNFNAHQPILLFLAQILLSEYAIKWCFAIPPFPTNVSPLPGETGTPEIGYFQSCGDGGTRVSRQKEVSQRQTQLHFRKSHPLSLSTSISTLWGR